MSPQIENGYIKIANELFEAFYRCKLSDYERIVVLCIWRKTYGFNKKEDIISLKQIQKETGIHTKHISRTLNKLIEKNVLIYKGEKKSINKNYYTWKIEWRVLPIQGLPIQGQGTPHTGIYKRHITKDINKEKQVSQFTNLIEEKEMKKNSFKYNESQHEDEFEVVIDLDSGEEVQPEKKKTRRKDADVIELQNIFTEICENEIGIKPIKDAKGYMIIKNALQYIEFDDIIDMYERWFKSGREREELLSLTACLSHNEINKFRLQKK